MKFCYNMNFTLPKQSKDLDPYKMDLGFGVCFGRKKNPSYNQRNTVRCAIANCFDFKGLHSFPVLPTVQGLAQLRFYYLASVQKPCELLAMSVTFVMSHRNN